MIGKTLNHRGVPVPSCCHCNYSPPATEYLPAGSMLSFGGQKWGWIGNRFTAALRLIK